MTLSTLSANEIFTRFLAFALLLGAYLSGRLMEAIKAPKVIGEIIGGMLFGGTFLHGFSPSLMESIFEAYPEEGKVLNLFYQMGLASSLIAGYWLRHQLAKDAHVFMKLTKNT